MLADHSAPFNVLILTSTCFILERLYVLVNSGYTEWRWTFEKLFCPYTHRVQDLQSQLSCTVECAANKRHSR